MYKFGSAGKNALEHLQPTSMVEISKIEKKNRNEVFVIIEEHIGAKTSSLF